MRLLLYSNEIKIEGIVAVTSTWLRHSIHTEMIHDVLEGYAQALPHLLRVDAAYPTVESLTQKVGEGVVEYGMRGVGSQHDSGGSEMLIKAVDAGSELQPLHVALWGGANCLAQVRLLLFNRPR